jgi:hypothetical protein
MFNPLWLGFTRSYPPHHVLVVCIKFSGTKIYPLTFKDTYQIHFILFFWFRDKHEAIFSNFAIYVTDCQKYFFNTSLIYPRHPGLNPDPVCPPTEHVSSIKDLRQTRWQGMGFDLSPNERELWSHHAKVYPCLTRRPLISLSQDDHTFLFSEKDLFYTWPPYLFGENFYGACSL